MEAAEGAEYSMPEDNAIKHLDRVFFAEDSAAIANWMSLESALDAKTAARIV